MARQPGMSRWITSVAKTTASTMTPTASQPHIMTAGPLMAKLPKGPMRRVSTGS